MAWVKLDDAFPEHEKVERVGDRAGWLFICGLCYCNRNRTDGLIPRARVSKLTGLTQPMKLAGVLVDGGLWERDGDDFRVHDYHDYQPSRDELEVTDQELSEKRAAAGRKGAEALWAKRGKRAVANGKPDGKTLTNGRQADGPVPQRDSANAESVEPDRLDEAAAIRDLFELWQRECHHPDAKLTDDRRSKLRARLREGYTLQQIAAGIRGAAVGAYVDDRNKRHDDLTLICRTGSKLEDFIGRAGRQGAKPQQRPDDTEERLEASRR